MGERRKYFWLRLLAGLVSMPAFAALGGVACDQAPKDLSRRLWDSLAYEGSYDPKAASICESMKYGLSKQACRDSLTFVRFSPSALDWCAQQPSDADKLSCLRELGNAYFNATAFGMCVKMRYPLNRNECFGATRNKAFDPDGLAKCARESFDSSRNQCLASNSICLSIRPEEIQASSDGLASGTPR